MDREYIDKPMTELDPTHQLGVFFGPHHAVIAKPNSIQVGGTHYQGKGIQPWDYVIANNMGYLEGCIIKYVTRYKDKNGLEDLKKAKHYLEKLMDGIGGA